MLGGAVGELDAGAVLVERGVVAAPADFAGQVQRRARIAAQLELERERLARRQLGPASIARPPRPDVVRLGARRRRTRRRS